MYSHSYPNGLMPRDHFEIWLRHHMRKYRYDIAEMSERTGETVTHITSVYNGHTDPCNAILKDMGLHKVILDKNIFYRSDSYKVVDEQSKT